ncbi:Stp1/IreP family PP2C-type Ser/Thr phosphatase [Candidatus Protochlamydia phocaeensis]|uniref:Stp1/IreP family PP2C-type Ser/Thr phosphatase n=1 Tax=Candidatus Protochlamydia phocaeensis TaxID=1414722 RepID=UPI000837ACB2|nr:Stp1/IreP family PP2C-type Ser/Thr phosphatase [Candidatus Protochlamydia phocaeensis]
MAFQVMLYKISVYGISDVGLVRQNNEDFWTQLLDDQFFVLADGMGGHQAGEIASKEAANHLCTIFKEKLISSDKSLKSVQKHLLEAIQEVNSLIFRMGLEHEGMRGMGTTLCCIFLHPKGIVYGHVGDSRIYRLRKNKLEQLTHDHSLLRELIDLGQLNEEQAEDFQYKNIITKAIGTEPYVEPSIRHDMIHANDILLMCTDGLTDLLSDQDIQRILVQTPEENMAAKLVETAKQRGGYDNITVVVIKIQEKYDSADLP